MKAILPVSAVLFLMGGIFVAQAKMKLPELKKQPTVQAADEHLMRLTNATGSLSRNPLKTPNQFRQAAITKGREAIGELCRFPQDTKDGGPSC